jgi:hypothetical protein
MDNHHHRAVPRHDPLANASIRAGIQITCHSCDVSEDTVHRKVA